MKSFIDGKIKMIVWIHIAGLAVSVLAILLTSAFHRPPRPDQKNIRCDYQPYYLFPKGLATDSYGNFYLFTEGGLLRFDPDWQYDCTFACMKEGVCYFSYTDDRLCFTYVRGVETDIYDLSGNYIETVPSGTDFTDMDRLAVGIDGTSYTYEYSFFCARVEREDGTVVWRGSGFGTVLRWCLLFFIPTTFFLDPDLSLLR